MDFLTDEQMAALEKASPTTMPDTISDEEMAQLEVQQSPAEVYGPYQTKGQRAVHEQMAQLTPENVGAAGRNALSAMTGGAFLKLAPEAGLLVNSAADGAIGAAQSPDDRLGGFLKGGLTRLGFGLASKAGNAIGDKAMQFAVGRKKYTPGVGTELADQGVWGTKGMMRDQVNAKVPEAWQEMTDAADAIPGRINNRQIGQEIYNEATAPLTGGGLVRASQRDLPLMAKTRAFAEDISSRGAETARQALAHRGAAGASAFSAASDLPLQNQMAKLSKLEQVKLSKALKAADPTGRMAEADAAYAALKRAQRPLNQEDTISGFGDLLGTTAKHLAAPIASTVGQAGVKGGKLAEWLAPLVRQSLVNKREE